MFYPKCFFFSPCFLRDPSTDRPETLPHDRSLAEFYKLTAKIRGGSPQKKFGAENLQNFGQFWTTSDFDREYLRNEATYPKSESVHELGKFLLRLMKKSRELWSTNGLELHVSLDPLKCTFLAYYISAIRGCYALKFLHALDIDQGYPAHSPLGRGSPENFKRAH